MAPTVAKRLGKGFIKEIFLGSVAHNVSRLAPSPVLLIPPESR
jgi:nucleotide-binding universal stress UspA family protein